MSGTGAEPDRAPLRTPEGGSVSVSVSVSDRGVARIDLAARGGRFVWGADVHRDLPRALRRIDADRRVKVAVLRSGENWCDEADASFGPPDRPDYWDDITSGGIELVRAFAETSVPLIAAVEGLAGQHPELPLLCDLVVASRTARFRDDKHLARGIVPGDGTHIVMPLLLGQGRAAEFLWLGGELDAEEARRLGIVTRLVDPGEAESTALSIAHELAVWKRSALTATRRLLWREFARRIEQDLELGFALEGRALFDSRDP